MHNLTTIDYAIIAIIGLSLIWGLFRGFIREAISIVTVTLALLLSVVFSDTILPLFAWLGSPQIGYYASFASIFIVVMALGYIVAKITGLMAKTLGFGWLDRILGGGFGAARGLLVVVMALFLFAKADTVEPKWVNQSVLVPQFKPSVVWMKHHFPSAVVHTRDWINKQTTSPSVAALKKTVSTAVNRQVNSKQ